MADWDFRHDNSLFADLDLSKMICSSFFFLNFCSSFLLRL
jgi:hypothetical protein